jgi:putative membrane protein
MSWFALLSFASLAAVLHLVFFLMESLLWTRPAVRRIFHTTPEEAGMTKFLAFNQGFYNMFLALGVFGGIGFVYQGLHLSGLVLIAFSCASMVGASLVLATGGKRRWRGALIQGLPPLVVLIILLMVGLRLRP